MSDWWKFKRVAAAMSFKKNPVSVSFIIVTVHLQRAAQLALQLNESYVEASWNKYCKHAQVIAEEGLMETERG